MLCQGRPEFVHHREGGQPDVLAIPAHQCSSVHSYLTALMFPTQKSGRDPQPVLNVRTYERSRNLRAGCRSLPIGRASTHLQVETKSLPDTLSELQRVVLQVEGPLSFQFVKRSLIFSAAQPPFYACFLFRVTGLEIEAGLVWVGFQPAFERRNGRNAITGAKVGYSAPKPS